MLCSGGFQSALQIIRHPQFYALRPHRDRSRRGLRRCKLRRVDLRISENCYAGYLRKHFLEQLHLLSAQLWKVQKHSRDIAAGTGKTLNKAHCYGVALEIYPDDRNDSGFVLSSYQCFRASSENDVDMEPNQLRRALGK